MCGSDAEPPCAQAIPPAREGAQVAISADDGRPAAKVSRDETGKGPLEPYLPACGALCDILWWARRESESIF
jgi:hypothetical protein